MIAVISVVSIAVSVTILWLGAAWVYVEMGMGWSAIAGLDPATLTALITAIAGPVAIFWLVIGFLGHLITLRHQNRAIRQLLSQAQRSTNHAEITTRVLMELRQQTRNALFFQSLKMVIADLNSIMATVAQQAGLVADTDIKTLWESYGAGDQLIFCNVFRKAAAADPMMAESLGKMAAAAPRLRADLLLYLARYEKLLRLATEHDEQHCILEMLQEGEHDWLHATLLKASRHMIEALVPHVQTRSQNPESEPEFQIKSPPPLFPETDTKDETGRPTKRRRGLFGVITHRGVSPLSDSTEPTNGTPDDTESTRWTGRDKTDNGSGAVARPFSPLNPDFPKQEGWPGDTEEQ